MKGHVSRNGRNVQQRLTFLRGNPPTLTGPSLATGEQADFLSRSSVAKGEQSTNPGSSTPSVVDAREERNTLPQTESMVKDVKEGHVSPDVRTPTRATVNLTRLQAMDA